MLASPLLNGGAEIALTSPLQSAGYVEMTIAEMEKFKISINRTPHGFAVCQGRYCSPGALSAEGDWSNAAFWLAAGALAGPVSVTGLNSASAQGDREIAEILRKFGAAITQREDNCTASSGALSAAEINAAQIPDLVPVLAVVASVSKGVTRIKNAARLRLKESDRLFTTAQMLSRLGADIQEESDGLAIIGKPRLSGGAVSSFGDHRIAMAAAVAACACTSPVVITGAEATGKSYPSFWEDYQALGGVLHVI